METILNDLDDGFSVIDRFGIRIKSLVEESAFVSPQFSDDHTISMMVYGVVPTAQRAVRKFEQ